MTWTLIALNILVFLYQSALPEALENEFVYLFGLVPARFSHPEWAMWVGFPVDNYWPFLTSIFLHGSWLHLLGNMWTLWIFGDNVEDRMGPFNFLLFYLLCGIAASSMQFFVNVESTIPIVGASGAIAGVLGAYFKMFKHSQVIVFFPVIIIPFFFTIPAVLYLVIWFVSQLIPGWMSLGQSGDVGGVAWWAHIGGFVFGLLVYRLFLDPLRRLPFYPDEQNYRTLF
jgi:membrane associated rhomboid family serine protease